MKKLLSLIVLAAIIMAVVSCSLMGDDKSSKTDTGTPTAIERLTPEIREHLVAQDSLMKELVNKVDTLAEALNQAKKENTELKGKIESLQSPRRTLAWLSIGAIVLSVIAIILSFFRRGLNEHEVRAVASDCIDSSQKINNLQYHVNELKNDNQRYTRNAQSISSTPSNADRRLRQIEDTLNSVVSYINGQQHDSQLPTNTPSQDTRQVERTETQRVGYARIDYKAYFTTIYDSNQEGCAFKITFKSPTKGEFTILSLDRISSSNDWEEKIKCSGVSIKEASDFRVEELGVCEKIDENTWEVTRPLKIKLLK